MLQRLGKAIVGLSMAVFLLAIAYVIHVATTHQFAEFSDRFVRSPEGVTDELAGTTLDVSPITDLLGQCLSCLYEGRIPGPLDIKVSVKISYPTRIVVDETATVTLTYGVTVNGKDVDYLPKKFPDSRIALKSAGLQVTPSDPLPISKKTKLPITLIWTTVAAKAGDQAAIVSISQDLVETGKGILAPKYTLNDKSISNEDLRNIRLPMTAYTVWGITSFQYELLKLAAAVLGFLLTLPLLNELIKKFWPSRTSTWSDT